MTKRLTPTEWAQLDFPNGRSCPPLHFTEAQKQEYRRAQADAARRKEAFDSGLAAQHIGRLYSQFERNN